ncbi:hypothetical protein EYF80_016737 [Liparis tanakae]|uniref:Uncharacterized protein n=1 Tax=Liparis tanakae TaxID=230148 RepID=A0A4Z2I4X8_9TELE|nr:hypothetical protein EYF80_016737 [Liparis tanakae]
MQKWSTVWRSSITDQSNDGVFLRGNMLEPLCFLLSDLANPQHKQRRPYRAPAADTSAQHRIYLNLPLALAVLRGPRRGPPPRGPRWLV